jgi:hypothetical protein
MSRNRLLVPMALASLALSVGRSSPAGDPPAPPKVESGRKIEGTLTDARGYFNAGVKGPRYRYNQYLAMRADLPVGLLTDGGEFYYLAIEPRRLAKHAAKAVRVEGKALPGGRLVRPSKIWVKSDSGWEAIPDE